jgi:hypothetical protein
MLLCTSRAFRALRVRADPQAQTCSQNLQVSESGRSLPRFHENALLQVDGRDDDLADDGTGWVAGD